MPPKANRDRSSICFEATVQAVGTRRIVRLPARATKQLPSQGQVAVHAKVGGHKRDMIVEPDGEFGHWMDLDKALQKACGAETGDRISVELQIAQVWPEPVVPPDLRAALSSADKEVRELWKAITPMARWEWVRWINATRNPSTRNRRLDVSISKLSNKTRRPCCFNLASCTDPELAKSGKLSVR